MLLRAYLSPVALACVAAWSSTFSEAAFQLSETSPTRLAVRIAK